MAWFDHGTARVYYEQHGSGDPVLLLPGFAGSIDDLASLRQALSANHRVIAADLPGSGKSAPQPRAYTPSYYEEDARTFIALLAALGTGPAHLVGYSDGGEVSLVMAGIEPDAVRSVLTWGALGFVDASVMPFLESFETVVDDPVEPLRPFSDYLKATYGEDNARAMTRSFVNAARGILRAGGNIGRARAGEIGSPVLLIAGERDPLAPPALVSQLAALIPAAEFVPVAGAGHDVHRSHSQWLVQTALDWLAKS